ncbi:unnamed protein product [Prorocentrum cordatum]|uniref:Prolyl 4-hydroxylase alpha subunit domain-containing protein n=1 Tax=Prorocentrum cordatum TaxID=2364126 RepID=A0ABN9PDY2_9DINO|nr:unnamed protein product [Polarella glacialis]
MSCSFLVPLTMALRCDVLRRVVAVWECVSPLGADHLRHLQLLWRELDQVRVTAVARAVMEVRPARVGAATTMAGEEFFAAVREKGLGTMLANSGGLVQVLDVLPHQEALQKLRTLESLRLDEWTLSAQTNAADAEHRFWRYEGDKADADKSFLLALEPRLQPLFHAARYDSGGKITLHNDALGRVVPPEEVVNEEAYPAGTAVFRKIAVIYYLTTDWKEEYGGCLVDNVLDNPRLLVPKFNSLVAFLVPREHWVTEVRPGAPLRYTLFGWFSDGEPYPPGCPPPLGSGNQEHPAASLPHGPPPTPSPGAAAASKRASDAAAEAAEALERCEDAFRARFGPLAAGLRVSDGGERPAALLGILR